MFLVPKKKPGFGSFSYKVFVCIRVGLTSRNGWVSLKGIFRWYICSFVILHLGMEVSLEGILGGIDVDVILNSIVQIRARLGFWAHTNV